MTSTNFLGLNLPDSEDKFNIDDFNENSEILDEAVKNLSDSPRKGGKPTKTSLLINALQAKITKTTPN